MPALSAIAQKGSAAAGTDKVVLAEGLYVPASEIAALATATMASYDNATSGLMATDVQAAIDEIAGGGGGSVAGSDKQIQFNDGGAFGAEAGFEYDKTTDTLTVPKATLSGLLNLAKGSNIASASTTDIASATANFVHITGTTTITALGTAQAGAQRVLVFDGALTFTHNGTSLILPTGANITTAAGDAAFMVSEGSGNWRCVAYFKKDGSALAGGGGGGGLTNWTEAANSSAPNATVPVVSFIATNAATNVDVAITPKGSGAFTLQTADGTIAGGNKRGSWAIDLQLSRAGASRVASGSNSVTIGTNNAASGNMCTAIGSSCQATAANTTAIGISAQATAAGAAAFGNGSVASGVDATAVGGATADGGKSYGMGGTAATRGVVGMRSEGTSTDRPNNRLTLQGSTNSTTPVVLKSDAATVSATNQFRMSNFNNGTQLVSGRVLARLSGSGGAAAAWSFEAMMDRDGGTISLIGTVTPVLLYSKGTITGWSVAITVSGTFNCLTVTATGPSGATVNWAAELNSLETPG